VNTTAVIAAAKNLNVFMILLFLINSLSLIVIESSCLYRLYRTAAC
jgi:hypothetical protein